MTLNYTHADVLTKGVWEGWADPETDPTRIDWNARLRHAAIPFKVINGRPVKPGKSTGIRYGRNDLGHWGEALAADALVLARTPDGHRATVVIERRDKHGWAIPGGHVDPGEEPLAAAVRELAEETGLAVPTRRVWQTTKPRVVPDPRGSDEAWMVTVLCIADLGDLGHLPAVRGSSDAKRAAWVPADSYRTLETHLRSQFGGRVFPAHVTMLTEALG